jgi:hypothetical protein
VTLKYATQELQGDREVVLAAVSQYGKALYYASEELKEDREVVIAAVTQNGSALQWASDKLKEQKKAHKKVVLAAVTQNGDSLRYATQELQGDREVVLKAVTQNCLALHYVSEELKEDREVVLSAVTQNDKALQFTYEAFQNEIEKEIEKYEGSAQKLLDHYEKNLEVNFIELSGKEYSLENLQGLDSIKTIKESLNAVNSDLGLDYDITYDGDEIHDIFEFRRIFLMKMTQFSCFVFMNKL